MAEEEEQEVEGGALGSFEEDDEAINLASERSYAKIEHLYSVPWLEITL